jgi:hypothetical protein
MNRKDRHCERSEAIQILPGLWDKHSGEHGYVYSVPGTGLLRSAHNDSILNPLLS